MNENNDSFSQSQSAPYLDKFDEKWKHLVKGDGGLSKAIVDIPTEGQAYFLQSPLSSGSIGKANCRPYFYLSFHILSCLL